MNDTLLRGRLQVRILSGSPKNQAKIEPYGTAKNRLIAIWQNMAGTNLRVARRYRTNPVQSVRECSLSTKENPGALAGATGATLLKKLGKLLGFSSMFSVLRTSGVSFDG